MSPIKRELLVNYPVDWDELAAEIKAANHFICQVCDVECRQEPGDRSKPVLTVAHVDHDYSSPAIQVAPMCVNCHLRHDAAYGWAAHLRHVRMRRERAGQLPLLAPLSASDFRELEQLWPSLEIVPDGIDLFSQYPIVGGPL